MKETIAQFLKVKDFSFSIKDKNNKEIYREYSTGYWSKREYNLNEKEIYYENSDAYWIKREYDQNGKEIYFEDSDGGIFDRRPNVRQQTMITKLEEMVTRLEEDGLYALQGIKDAIKELKK